MPAVSGKTENSKLRMAGETTQGHPAGVDAGVIQKQQDHSRRIDVVEFMQAADELDFAACRCREWIQ